MTSYCWVMVAVIALLLGGLSQPGLMDSPAPSSSGDGACLSFGYPSLDACQAYVKSHNSHYMPSELCCNHFEILVTEGKYKDCVCADIARAGAGGKGRYLKAANIPKACKLERPMGVKCGKISIP